MDDDDYAAAQLVEDNEYEIDVNYNLKQQRLKHKKIVDNFRNNY